MPTLFPYERYETINTQFVLYYPTGEEDLARWVQQTIERAGVQLSALLKTELPDFDVLLVNPQDWELVPHSESEELDVPHPYMTDVTTPPTFVVPIEIDPIFGEVTPEKFAFMLYHELAVTFLEDYPFAWPENSPLWADEWQFEFVALWLSHTLDHVQGVVNKDLHEQYTDAFEPEADGKTPVTIRGFDWYDDTSSEDFLIYELLLEQFAADLLARYDIGVLMRFLAGYRVERDELLSDEVTKILAQALGDGAEEWLEGLTYF